MAEKEYTVVAPDGKEITLIGPVGASQSEIIAQAQRLYKPNAEPTVTISETTVNPQFAETGGGAAVGRPTRNVAQIQPEPRPLESALIGGFKGGVVDPILGTAKLLTGGNVGQEASQSMAQQAKPYQEANPMSYLGGNIIGSVAPSAAIMKGASLLPSLAKLPEYGQALATMGGTGVLSGMISPEETGKTGQEFYKEQAKKGAIEGAIGSAIPTAGALANLLRANPQTPQMVEAIKKSRDLGYVIPPTQANSTLLNKALEGISGKISTAQNASAKNQQVTNSLASKALGLPEDTMINPEMLKNIRNTAGQAYENLKLSGTVKTSPKFIQALENIKPYQDAIQAAKDFPEKTINPVIEVIDSLKRPSFDVNSAVAKINVLRTDADKAFRTGDTALGKANKGASQVLENTIENHLANTNQTELLNKFREARQLIAKTYSVEKALNPATGTVNAANLAAQLKKGKPLSTELKDIAEFNLQFPKATQTTEAMGSLPQLSPLDFATGIIAGSNTGGVGAGAMLARPIARSKALSPMVPNRIIQQPSKSNDLAKLLMMQGASKAFTGE